MYNTPTGNLTLTVYRNNVSVLTKQIPAIWFQYVHQTYLNDTDETSCVKITNDQGQEFMLDIDPYDPTIDSQDSDQVSQRIYNLLQTSIANSTETAKQLVELQRILAENQRQAEAESARLIEETRQHEERRTRQEIENEKKSQAELESIFQAMVKKRQEEKAEVERLKAEYELRIKTLTETLLPNLKNDPTTVIDVLTSEIMQDDAVQIAVGEAITASDEACELVIKSPEHLWATNFIIMRSIILKVTYNKKLAQMISNVFPSDHLLISMLNKVGR
jgi:hypothetical protein